MAKKPPIIVPIDLSATYDAASIVLAWLAYPTEIAAREKFGKRLMIRARAAELFGSEHDKVLKKTVYTSVEKGLTRIIKHRWLAGLIATGLMSGKYHSLNDASKIAEDMGRELTRDFRERFVSHKSAIKSEIWTPSKSVIHLSCALLPLLHSTRDPAKPVHEDSGNIYELIKHADWVPAFIEASKVHRKAIAEVDSSVISVTEEQMIDFEIMPSGPNRKFL